MPAPVSTAAQVVEAEIASAIAKSQAAVWVPETVVPFPEPQAEAQLKPVVRAAPPAWDRVEAAALAAVVGAVVEAVAGEDDDSAATT
jgi:hypothetical protein